MIRYLCFAIFLLSSFCVRADKLRDDIDCAAIFSEDHIFARFPVLNQKKLWKWHVVERTAERPEYAWIAETGKYRNGKFEGDGFAYSLLIGSANLQKTPPQEGKLKELLSKTKKMHFLQKNLRAIWMSEEKTILIT
ncbi:hypothetical protein [Paracidovorax valerianellae]|uniref:hypothetical protein n=1 Tax=Paracidovorax valerianellae TaxID=187868 RepID=UPI00111357DC|nr:hypothetical protein [Paracidovorax valerianellae]MDA8443651.1 hypothetical protein [Paracidovorax valerianellae]